MVPLRTSVHRDPKAAQGITQTDCGGADGWQPKSLRNREKPACWEGTWSPTAVAQVPVTSREMATVGWNSMKPALQISSWAKVQSQPRSSPRWGDGNSRAQWKTSEVMQYWHHWYHDVSGRDFTVILTEAFFQPPMEMSWKCFTCASLSLLEAHATLIRRSKQAQQLMQDAETEGKLAFIPCHWLLPLEVAPVAVRDVPGVFQHLFLSTGAVSSNRRYQRQGHHITFLLRHLLE